MLRLFLLALAVLPPSSLSAADISFDKPKAFSARIPDDWIVEDQWRGPSPSLGLRSADGDYRILVTKYTRDNPYRMTFSKFVADLRKRAPKVEKAKPTAGASSYTIFRGLIVSSSPWSQPHFEPDDSILGPSEGDHSVKSRLLRCREQGAWRKYDWYREASSDPKSLALFYKHFTEEDRAVMRACLGPGALTLIDARGKADEAVIEPDDAGIEALARASETPTVQTPEESVAVHETKNGFYVVRYDSPPGKQDRHWPVYLRLLSTFTPAQ